MVTVILEWNKTNYSRDQTAIPTSPAGAAGVMADIIKFRDTSCYLEGLVKGVSLAAAMQEE